MRSVAFATAADLGLAVAMDIRDGLAEAAANARVWTLGLPSGRTCLPVLEALGGLRDLDLEPLRILLPDAYCVRQGDSLRSCPDDAPHSVYEFLRCNFPKFWTKLGTTKEDRILVPRPDRLGEISRTLGGHGIDLMLVASGSSDGHVAFNSPGSSRTSTERIVTLPPSTRRDNLRTYPHFGSLSAVPEIGVTIGIDDISAWSHRAVLILTGREKAEALRRVQAANSYDEEWPSTIIHECRSARIYTDQGALNK